ncbi:MAG TPA: TPM domain-containing protein [Pelomicrobium sp.]|nr:TPM domain-containing protein [Pelomicrobium sp.]
MTRLLAAALAALALGGAAARAEVPVPPLKARVTDLTGTLNAGQIESLESRLAAFEAKKGSQVAVLLVPTTRPEAIEQYAIRVAEQWQLGRKGIDDGVLLLVAKNDRQLRIEVGYGLEGALPDAIAKRIISEIIVPRLREGDFYGGVSAGVERIIGVIEGEPLPVPQRRERGGASGAGLETLLVAGVVLAGIGGAILRATFGRLPAAGMVGAAMGALGWFLLGTLIAGIVVGVVAFLFTLGGGTGHRVAGGRGGRTGGWSGRGGGWSRGGGGGGFGGGGGGFGGGGASGRW